MFDKYKVDVDNNTNIKINQVSGSLAKTHSKSFFINFHYDSHLASTILSNEPYLEKGHYERTPIVVLQLMLSFDGYYVAEIVKKEDFE